MVEVAGLTIVPNARVLYAATHGLGAWELDLPRVSQRDHHGNDGNGGSDGSGSGGGGDH